ncbi:MAG: 26S proteasome non-ATPase regulatory subunit 8 [Paramarteilia canceri]
MVSGGETKNLSKLVENLKKKWSKTGPSLDQKTQNSIFELLDQCDDFLIELDIFPEEITSQNVELVLLAREIMEIGAHFSILIQDFQQFESYYAKLNTYYFQYNELLESSPYMLEMIALHLMNLLSNNLITDFLQIIMVTKQINLLEKGIKLFEES